MITLRPLVTDGLVGHRHEDLEHSLSALAGLVGEVGAADPEGVCAKLLDRLLPDGSDDVALMAVRVNAVSP
ncbi:SpoIIE family protein phosphatase [Streptomyces sp. IBSBF 3136]|uniref:SpoIIE family protein phosphatase n=1 Tax=Streptomyces sp. IBSBF 3136 TaxID=2903524 RepID=UPI002FDC26C3